MTAKPKRTSKITARSASDAGIGDYPTKQTPESAKVCDTLRTEINAALPQASSKIWHGAPVWFIDDFPVVGYSLKAIGVTATTEPWRR